jgi:RNA polymerase sigma-70 factor (ECF subfamily)
MVDTSVSLLDRVHQQPDAGAWQRLVDLYTPLLQQWLARYSLQESDRDDLVQEVLAVVVRKLPDFLHNQQRGAFRSWLRTILVNCLHEFWRAGRSRRTATGGSDLLDALQQLEDPHSSLSHLWDHEHDQQVVRRALELIEPDFKPKTWQAFRRQVLGGETPQVVAADLGMSVNALVIAKSRVLHRLRQELRELVDDPL